MGEPNDGLEENEKDVGDKNIKNESNLSNKNSESKSSMSSNEKEIHNEKDTASASGSSSGEQKKIFTFEDEERDQFYEKQYIIPKSPKTPIFNNHPDNNEEVILRPHNQRYYGITSARVSAVSNTSEPRKTHSTGDLQKMRYRPSKAKNDNMVLQLVLPPGNHSIHEDNNYYNTKSMDDILGNGHIKERLSRPPSMKSHQDYYLSPPHSGSYINRAYSAGDLSEYRHSIEGYPIPHTPASTGSSMDKPTPPEEKKREFVYLITNVCSIIYAMFNITLGIAIYIGDIIHTSRSAPEIFSLYLVVVAFVFISYLTLDIYSHMRKKRRLEKLLEQNGTQEVEFEETEDGHFKFHIPVPEIMAKQKQLSHDYCFTHDRHSTNFYLKIGAAAFCFGHLIHSCLIIGYQIVFLKEDREEFFECSSTATLVLEVIYPMYSFLLLFFMFKYSNVIINRNLILARFGVMHCLSSSLCFWIWTIFRETIEAIAHKDYDTNDTSTESFEDSYSSETYASPSSSYGQKGAQVHTGYVPIAPLRFTGVCDMSDQSMSTIYKDFSPYLYPFSVEYSILVVGVLYLVWQNIGMCKVDEDGEDSTRQCKSPPGNGDNMESNVVVHADCHSSNKGLFTGFMILVLTIVSIILFFISIYSDDGQRGETGITINIVTTLFILVLMTATCVFAYRQITKLDINSAHHNLLDDILLFICIPAYFFNGIFSIVPAIIYGNVIGTITICIEVLQVLIQTVFILDGLRRSSNTKYLRKLKPGREVVTFLVISNVCLWIMQTFEVKSHGMQDNRYDFYGKELWTIMGHMCLPLMMFYRFHSSVCIGDIWKYAYEPSGH